MKKTIPAFLFCIISFFGVSQSSVEFTLKEDFNNNDLNWNTVNETNKSFKVENGKYIFDIKDGSWWWNGKSAGVQISKTFTIESKFSVTYSDKDAYYGINIGSASNENYMFLLSAVNSNYCLVKYDKANKSSFINDWTNHSAINYGADKSNEVKIIYKNEEFEFIINGTSIFRKRIDGLSANVGYFIYYTAAGPVNVGMEYIYVSTELNLLPGTKKGYKKINLGTNINSNYADLSPVISPDGKTLYFSVSDCPENTDSPKNDVYYSELGPDGNWGPRKNLGRPVNEKSYNGVVSVSPDNNSMLLINKYDEKTGEVVGTGVSRTYRTAAGWANPKPLNIKNFVNLNAYNEYCLSPNGNVLLLTIETKTSFGEKDVYVSFRSGEGDTEEWSEPVNIGKTVNTKFNESSPFIAADGVSLYFSSNGHPGYGSNDIFVTKRLDDTWLNWSEPQNMGPDINSNKWEAYYTIPANGKNAYMVIEENSTSKSDIVRIEIPETARPLPVMLVKGRVLNAKTKEPLQAKVAYSDLKTGKASGVAMSSPKDGYYQIVLPQGVLYSFNASKEGFISVDDNIDATNLKEYKEIYRDLYLSPFEVGATVRLNNVFFDFNKSVLKEDSYKELDKVVEFLIQNPTVIIEIGGHTDNVGGDELNKKLSNDRAKAVYDYLRAKNIEAARISSKGYGKAKPVDTNDTDEGRQNNRRVEFTILKK